MPNEFGCNLFIDTDYAPPDIVTEITGMPYSKILIKGEAHISSDGRVIPQKRNEHNLWILNSERMVEEVSFHTQEGILSILKALESRKSAFTEVFERFSNRKLLCYAYYSQYNPYFALDRQTIRDLAEFGLMIEFDLYYLGDDDESVKHKRLTR